MNIIIQQHVLTPEIDRLYTCFEGRITMAQLTVRLPDDFYKQVQWVVNFYLEMDLSTFVRELFIDTILLYEGADLPRTRKALAAIGQKHRVMGPPALLLTLADFWRGYQEFLRDVEKEPTELEKKMYAMQPEELKQTLREQGRDEKSIEAYVGGMKMSEKEMVENLANDPELARIDKMTKEEREKYLMDMVWDRMVKARRERRRETMAAERESSKVKVGEPHPVDALPKHGPMKSRE
jgi:hypothetical protein